MVLEIRPLTTDELEAAFRIRTQAFNISPQQLQDYRASLRLDRTLGAFDAGQLIATAVVHELAQFFGGRPVPMGGVASVAVVPHRCGSGVVTRLLGATLEVMHERGEVISTLYPATAVPYRRMGWEVAGYRVHRRVPLRSLATLPPPAARVAVCPSGESDLERLAATYATVATKTNGFVHRNEWWWPSVARVSDRRRAPLPLRRRGGCRDSGVSRISAAAGERR
ncbi:MAG: enhanced intracellular survival protein Eis [Nitriliruptorales bacterium]